MLKLKNDKALETYKIFPYIAWITVILFAYFVYGIAVELQTVANDLKIQTKYLQEKIDTPVGEITNFDKKPQ